MEIPPKIITVTRQDAIHRQLNTAIYLWFNDADIVSIHTLACASLDMADDLAKHRGMPSLLFSNMTKGEITMAVTPRNFFKHADRDPEHVLDFPPDQTEFHMYFAICTYEKLYGLPLPELMRAFFVKFMIDRPNRFPPETLPIFPKLDLNALRQLGRAEFLKGFLEAFRE
jgi:hypothetical protein